MFVPSPTPSGPLDVRLIGAGVARLVARAWGERTAIQARMRTLASSSAALDLRLARLLGWLRVQDLAPLGYPGWLAFTREHVDWGESWIRSLLRLVRSGLREVLQAACTGRIPLTVAVSAPSVCPPGAEAAWIAAIERGDRPPKRRPSGASFTIEPTEADALAIWHARGKVRRLEGLPLRDREADERMLAWWRERRQDLVARALAPAPPPPVAPGDTEPEWGFADPADSIVGPWRTPRDLSDALELLGQVQAARRERAVELGQLYERVVREGLHRLWGFPNVEAFCQATAGISARSLQRHRALGRTLRHVPALRAAADAGMSLARVEALARLAPREDVERWIAVARRTPVGEIARAARHIEAGADPDALLAAYEAVPTTGTVALAAVQAPVPPTLTDRVHPDLPAAARWLLELEIPPQHGFGKVKERDRFVCANPECRRPAYRNHAHHKHFRRHGGADTPENGLCVCPSCHLRLIHAGHVRVEAVGDTHVWTYPGRTVTVASTPATLG